jgi:Uma2 family endonuclease
MSTTTASLTFAEFEKLPDAPGKRELVQGELVEMPPPHYRHRTTATQESKAAC